jgi:hypothetical protein
MEKLPNIGPVHELTNLYEDFPWLQPVDRLIITNQYYALQQKYGDPESPAYRAYHNHDHGYIVTSRGQQLWRALSFHLPDIFKPEDARLLAVASIFHDGCQDYNEFARNERVSAEMAVAAINKHSSFYLDDAATRVVSTIMTTVVKRDDNGVIKQINIREGDKDPLKLGLALPDINGILMGGAPVMVDDGLRLFMETNGYRTCREVLQNARNFGAFLQTEAGFLRGRVSDIDGDVDYYFDDEQTRAIVKKVLADLFQPGIHALELASMIEKPQEALKVVDWLLQSGASSLLEVKSELMSFFSNHLPTRN